MYTYSFEKLDVWKEAKEFTKSIYILTSTYPDSEKFGLISQLRRASVSICSNIAEGSSKSSDKHFIIYLENALGSCYEIETQLLVSSELGYISSDDLILLSEELTQIIKMIIKFIKYLQNKL